MTGRILLLFLLFLRLPGLLSAQGFAPTPGAVPDTCPTLLLQPATDLACGPGHGRATFRVTGGSGNYDFLWSNGSTDSLLTDLDNGNYSVTVSDQGCITVDSIRLEFTCGAFPYSQHGYGNADDNNAPVAAVASPDGQFFYSTGFVSKAGLDVDSVFGSLDIWVVKTDRAGQLVWAKTFGGNQADRPSALIVLADGSLTVTGTSASHDGLFADTLSGVQPFLLHFSPDGTPLWLKKIAPGPESFGISKIVARPDGGYVFAGDVHYDNPYHTRIWLGRLDAEGLLLWSQFLGTNTNYMYGDLVADPAGGYVISCEIYASQNPISSGSSVVKFSEDGTVLWELDDPRLSRAKLFALPDGHFLAGANSLMGGQYQPILARFSENGTDTVVHLLPGSDMEFKDLIRLDEGGWAVLTAHSTVPVKSSLILVDSLLRPGSEIPVLVNRQAKLAHIFELGRDTFAVSGTAPFGELRKTDWLFSTFRVLPRQPGIWPAADTLICPNSNISLTIDSSGGFFGQFGWPEPEDELPSQWQIGRQDTLLWMVARNSLGCLAGVPLELKIDPFEAALEVDGSTCGLANGRIWISSTNNQGPVQVAWADGGSDISRAELPPGMYPVSVGDGVCTKHFVALIDTTPAPQPAGYFTPPIGVLFTGYGWGSSGGEISTLTDGTPVYWIGNNHLVRVNFTTPLNTSFSSPFTRLVALPDTGFAILGSYSPSPSKLYVFNRSAQLTGQFTMPDGISLSDLVPVAGGGYLLLGTKSWPNVDYDTEPRILRLNQDFGPMWSVTLSAPQRREDGMRLATLEDGRIVVMVRSEALSGNALTKLRLYMLDSAGSVLWSRFYGGEGDEFWQNLAVSPDGGLICVAQTNANTGDLAGQNPLHNTLDWLFRVSSDDGALQWSRLIPNYAKVGFLPDGGPLFGTTYPGYSNGFSNAGYERLTALDPLTGDTSWSVRALDAVMLNGTPYYAPGGDILWPHLWWDNYHPGPSDGHCCPFADFHLQINVLENGEIPQAFDLGPDTTLCIGDTLLLSAQGANVPLTWQDGAHEPLRSIATAGIYTVRAGHVCPFSDTVRVDYCLYSPLPDSLTGCAPLHLDGGMPGLQHEWSNGSHSQSLYLTENAWLYLTVTNLSGQTMMDSVYVVVFPFSNFETVESDISCFGAQDGLIAVTPSGEGAPYTYLWSDAATDSLRSGLPPGTYELTVTDQFGCSFAAQFVLTQPVEWGINLTAYPNADSTQYSVYAPASPSPPGPLSFLWSTGSTLNNISVSGGQVSVTVTDGNGCAESDTLMLPLPHSAAGEPWTGELSVWPNPAADDFRVENIPSQPWQMELRDGLGRIVPVFFETETLASGAIRLKVHCPSSPPGMYSLILRWPDTLTTLRIIRLNP